MRFDMYQPFRLRQQGISSIVMLIRCYTQRIELTCFEECGYHLKC